MKYLFFWGCMVLMAQNPAFAQKQSFDLDRKDVIVFKFIDKNVRVHPREEASILIKNKDFMMFKQGGGWYGPPHIHHYYFLRSQAILKAPTPKKITEFLENRKKK